MQNANQFLRKRVPECAKLCFNRGHVSVNFEISQIFQRLLKEEGSGRKIKLRVTEPGGANSKIHQWSWDSQTFSDCLSRLGLSDADVEAGYIDDDKDYIIISSEACVKELLEFAKQKGPSTAIYIDIKPLHRKISVAAVARQSQSTEPQDHSSPRETSMINYGINYIKKTLHLMGATKPEVEKHEPQTARKYGQEFVSGLSVRISNSLICGVPEDKWQGFVEAHKAAKQLPDEFVQLFKTLEYQDRMHERIVVPAEGGLRHLTLQAIKHGGRAYGFWTDTCFLLPVNANKHISQELIKSIKFQDGRVRKFSVWPPAASMNGTQTTIIKDVTLAVPDGTEIVRAEDPDMDTIKKEVIEAVGTKSTSQGNEVFLVCS